MKMVALIPARAGSKRIPWKNMRELAGRPLVSWTMQAARDSGVFDFIVVSTDDEQIASLANCYIEQCAVIRPAGMSNDDSPDIHWVRHALAQNTNWQSFAILRPTSPFRTADTIRRAYARFHTQEVHSMRAVQPVKEHPGKMWTLGPTGHPMVPLLHRSVLKDDPTPWHSMPTQSLPPIFVQNASLEMAWSWVVPAFGTISGTKVAPFLTEGYEGFDLNTMDDWREAERLIEEGKVALPTLARV